jgi:hypothetical protein
MQRTTEHTDMERLLTPAEVSEYLGIPMGTLANWRYLGLGPSFVRLGRHVRYRHLDLSTWVERHVAEVHD